MKKILASLLAITMLMTTMSACIIPASAEDAAVATSYIYNEDFNEYATDVNWLLKTDDNSFVTGLGEGKENTWSVYGYGYLDETDSTKALGTVKVVTESTATGSDTGRGNVLRIDVNGMAADASKAGKNWIHVKANANGSDGIARAAMADGKKLVLSTDVFVPSTRTGAYETGLMRYMGGYKNDSAAASMNYGKVSIGSNINASTSIYAIMNGTNWGYYGFTRTSKSIGGKWVTLKRIVDVSAQTSAERPADTTRFIHDGALMTVKVGTEGITTSMDINSKFKYAQGTEIIDTWQTAFKGTDLTSTLPDFYGVSFSNAQPKSATASTNTEYFIDNVKAYWIDAFKQEGTITYGDLDENGNYYKGQIEIPFNNEIAETVTTDGVTAKTWALTDLLYLVDEDGNVVEGGIASAELSDDNKTLLVTPEKGLEAGKKFTITADARFSDVELQGLSVTGEASETTELASFTMGVDPYAHIIYDFDFDNYEIDGKDWIENIDTTNRYVTIDGVEEGAITINKSSSASANHEIKVVYDPTVETPDEKTNKVLALKAGTDQTNGKVTKIRFNANGNTGLSRSTDMGKGKKLVYKTKIFIPADFNMTESSQLVNAEKENDTNANKTSGIGGTLSNGFYVAATGSWNYPMARSKTSLATDAGTHSVAGKWVEWKHVADVSKPLSATHSDTVRAYVDDKLVTTTVGSTGSGLAHGTNAKYTTTKAGDYIIDYLPGASPLFNTTTYASIGDTWWGSHFTINPYVLSTTDKNNGIGIDDYSDTFYLDDVEAYWIDALTFDTVNAENFEGGKVKLNFNQIIRDNVEYYVGTSVIASNYKTIALEDMFTIFDDEGNVVENGIAAVALSADGKTVSITPSAELVKGADYQIEISPYLIDEYGQGLENNSAPTYVDLHISETFTPFELLSISQTSVSGFAQYRDVKVTAKFSVAVDDDSITNGVVVTNTDTSATVARNAGWTASYGTDDDGAVDYKTVVFDFGSLPTANYKVTLNENFLAANGAELASAFKITITAAAQPIVLFNETFDDVDSDGNPVYTAGENWINDNNKVTDSSIGSSSLPSYTVDNHKWDVQTQPIKDASTVENADDFVGVVDSSKLALGGNFSGNVLRIYNSRATEYGYGNTVFRRNFNGLDGISLTSGEYAGKKLVYEADVYSDAFVRETSFMIPSNELKTIRVYTDLKTWKWYYNSSSQYTAQQGTWANASSGPIYMYYSTKNSAAKKATAHKLTIVLDQTSEVDTMRAYMDGTLISATAPTVLDGHAINGITISDFGPAGYKGQEYSFADTIYGVWGVANGTTIYVDNLKAYLVDSFDIESVTGYGDVFNTAKATVDFTFSKAVNENTVASNVVLLDATGTEVAGGIEFTAVSDGGYKLSVKLSETLPGSTQYTVKIKDGLKDTDGLSLSQKYYYYNTYDITKHYEAEEDGTYNITIGTTTVNCTYTERTASTPATLKRTENNDNVTNIDCYLPDYSVNGMKTEVSLTTSKSTSLFGAATATNDGGIVTVNATFTNPETDVMPVWAVVAVYGEYNEMLGCTIASVTSIDAGSTASDTITVNVGDSSKVKTIKLHVWNSYDAMVPYHKAETLTSE